MSLLVCILRITMLFLNVYESFKTLKLPTPSARTGQRTLKAMSQRKRDMKGCLAVWIVWCCFAVYERMVEGVICLLIPFYDEFKSFLLLFLILTRARGAEPIYLHIIRPLVKPYTPTLDTLLEVTCTIGDLLFLLSTLPFRFALSWWQGSSSDNEGGLDSESDLHDSSTHGHLRGQESSHIDHNGSSHPTGEPHSLPQRLLYVFRRMPGHVKSDSHKPICQASTQYTQGSVGALRQALAEGLNERLDIDTTNSKAGLNHSRLASHIPIPEAVDPHQIWRPPLSSYDDAAGAGGIRIDQALLPSSSYDVYGPQVPQSTLPEEPALPGEQIDEWRKYPAFPSAYPPTPLAAPSKLPSNSGTVSPVPRHPSDTMHLPPIPEDSAQQVFGRSLLPPREPLNPGFVGSLSDENNHGTFGVHSDQSHEGDLEMTIGDDESDYKGADADDDDDDFDITLRTPRPPSRLSRAQLLARLASIASSSVSSLPSQSTALTTVDNGSSLRTRTTSESSASISISDSSSMLGRKRSLPRNKLSTVTDEDSEPEGLVAKTTSVREFMKPKARRHLPFGKVDTTQQRPLKGASVGKRVDEGVDDSIGDTASDENSVSDRKPPDVKRRRVVAPRTNGAAVDSTRTPRPAARRKNGLAVRVARPQQPKSSGVLSSIATRASARLRTRRPGMATSTVSSQVESSANNLASSSRTNQRNQKGGSE